MVITPPIGEPTSLAGYAGRKDFALGIRDDLYASAVVFDDGKDIIAIVSLDLLGLQFDTVDEIKSIIEKHVGIPPENVQIHCTHTHQAPDMLGLFYVGRNFEYLVDEDYLRIFPRYVAGAVIGAFHKRIPALIGSGRGWGAEYAANRRLGLPAPEPNLRTIDPNIGVVKVENKSTGELMGVIANFGAHPTVFGGDEPLISADYIGALRNSLASLVGEKPVLVYLNGASGDVAPSFPLKNSEIQFQVDRTNKIALMNSFREWCGQLGTEPEQFVKFFSAVRDSGKKSRKLASTLREEDLEIQLENGALCISGFSNFEAITDFLKILLFRFMFTLSRTKPAHEIGEGLAREIFKTLENIKVKDGGKNSVAYGEVELKFDDPNMAVEVPAFHQSTHFILKGGDDYYLRVAVQILRCGDILFLGFPGEIINEIGLRMKEIFGDQSSVELVCVSEIANGMIAYILTPSEWDAMGYETTISIGRDAGKALQEKMLQLGSRLFHSSISYKEMIKLPQVSNKPRKITDRIEIEITEKKIH